MPPTRDLVHNPGTRPEWEWKQRPPSLQEDANPLRHTTQVRTSNLTKKEALTEILIKYRTSEKLELQTSNELKQQQRS